MAEEEEEDSVAEDSQEAEVKEEVKEEVKVAKKATNIHLKVEEAEAEEEEEPTEAEEMCAPLNLNYPLRQHKAMNELM